MYTTELFTDEISHIIFEKEEIKYYNESGLVFHEIKVLPKNTLEHIVTDVQGRKECLSVRDNYCMSRRKELCFRKREKKAKVKTLERYIARDTAYINLWT